MVVILTAAIQMAAAILHQDILIQGILKDYLPDKPRKYMVEDQPGSTHPAIIKIGTEIGITKARNLRNISIKETITGLMDFTDLSTN
jgi:hypothetical protein